MTPSKLHLLAAAFVIGAFSACSSTTASRYAVSPGLHNRASLDHAVATFAARNGLQPKTVAVPAFFGVDRAVYARYRDEVDTDVTLAEFDYGDYLEARLTEHGPYGLHPSLRFLHLDAELRRDLSERFGGDLRMKTDVIPAPWSESYLIGY